MNTSGIQRSYMAKDMKKKELLKVVIAAISREFEREAKLVNMNDNEFRINFGDYNINVNKELIKKCKPLMDWISLF